MEKEILRELILKFKAGTITEKELNILQNFVAQSDCENELDEFALSQPEHPTPTLTEDEKDAMFSKIWDKVNSDVNIVSIKRKRNWVKLISISAVAASILFGIVFLKYFVKDNLEHENRTVSTKEVIQPGGAKAKLLLEDGSSIDLESLRRDTIIKLEGYSIKKNKDGNISYLVNNSAENSNSILYNTIITPKGGEYKLDLPDGTKIWVNATSKLKYPLSFTNESREVDLIGEAYFEVAKKTRNGKRLPFIVKTHDQTLEVLGTSFNINSFGKKIKTTLVEGKVKLNFINGSGKELAPNQQVEYNLETQRAYIKDIDPFYAIAWKNGAFAFEDTPLAQVMETLSRWYDIDVSYKTDISNLKFTGTISKYEKIQKILEVIELTESIKFKIEGRRVIVK